MYLSELNAFFFWGTQFAIIEIKFYKSVWDGMNGET